MLALPELVLGETGKVTLAWDPIQNPNLAGYTVVWGEASRNYTNSQNFGIVREATIEPEAGKTYYFAVRGFDNQGVPGELSQEVSAFIRGSGNFPLAIYNISITNVTSSSATISWETNQGTYGQVQYGKDTSLGSSTGLTNVLSNTQTVTLNNLSSATTYYFRSLAKDLSGNQALSEILSFRTTDVVSDPNPDPTAPVKFTQITLSNVSSTSVTVNWSTDKAATGLLEYGMGTTVQNNSADATLATTHAIPLHNLVPSSVYQYRITAEDADGKLALSGTLMFKTSDGISQPAQPSPDAIFIPSIVENSRFRTNLGVNNLATTVANVSITLVDKQGMVLASKTVQVDPKGLKQINSAARFLWEDHLNNDVEGNLYLESDQPICAWASQIDNSTNDPSLLLSKQGGTTRILIPSAANNSSFSSSLVVMNVGITTAQVSLKAYGVNGAVLGQTMTPLFISPNGVLSFGNVLQTLGVTNNYGPIEINSLNSVPLVATSRVSSTAKAGGFFEGLSYSKASTTQVIPNIVDNSQLRTNIGINNLADNIANVTVRLIGKDGGELGVTSTTVAGRGLNQMNSVVRQLLNQPGVTNFEGYIRLESSQPIFGWASIIDNATDDPGFAEGKGAGSTALLVESVANMGSFKSSLVIVNMGDSSALVDILSHDVTGQINGELRSIVIPARGYFSSDNILERLGVSNNFGPIEITSTNGQPIIATSRVYSTLRTSGFLQGEAVE